MRITSLKALLVFFTVLVIISPVSASIGDQSDPAQSCKQIKDLRSGANSGIYWINPDSSGKFQIYCDMDYDGGGWTLLMTLDDDDNQFTYDSSYWENTATLNADDRNPFDSGFGSNLDGPRKYESFHRLEGNDLRIEFGNPNQNVEYEGSLGGVTALDKFSGGQDLTLGTDDASGSCDNNDDAYGVANHNSYDNSNMALGLSIAGSGINIESDASQRNDKARFGIMSEEDTNDGYSAPRYVIGRSGASVDWNSDSETGSCGVIGTTQGSKDTSAALWIRENTRYQATAEVTEYSSSVDSLDSDEFVMGRPIETKFNYTMNPSNIQVAFAVDETYSMSPVMTGVKDNIQWFYRELGGGAEGTVVGSGAGDDNNHRDPYHFTDDPYPSSALPEPRDLTQVEGLTSDTEELEDAAGRLRERTYFEGPDSTVAEAVDYGSEASDYTGSTGYYGDEDNGWEGDASKAVIWVQDGQAGYGSCSGISDFSEGGLGDYMQDNGFSFYAIVRDLSGCGDDFSTAASQTNGEVYSLSNNPSNEDWEDILGNISSSIESEVDLTVAVSADSYSNDDFDDEGTTSEGYKTYTFNDINSTRGEHSVSLRWRPTDYGNMDIKTGESYIEVDGPSGTNTYDFAGTREEDVKYVDLNVSTTSIKRVQDTIYANVTLKNKGNTPSKERSLQIRDEGGNFINRSISSIPAGSTYKEEIEAGANNDVFQNAQRISAYFDYRGFFNTLPMGKGEVLEPDESDNEKLMGYPPNLVTSSPDEVNWGDSFNFAIDFDHYYKDAVSGNYTAKENRTVIHESRSFNKPAEGVASTDEINNDESRIFYNFSSRLVGPEGAKSFFDHSFYVENPLPEIYGAEPKNMESVPEEVQLRAYVRDENNVENPNDLSVKLYDQETGELMLSETGISEGDRVETLWPEADQKGKTYRWNLTVSDRWDTVSEVFRFRKSSREDYRISTESEEQYSAIVTGQGSPQSFQYTVSNSLDFDKGDMVTSLSGVNASFRDGSMSKSYSLPNGTSKTFDIIVKPNDNDEGQEQLVIETSNNELAVNSTDRIPVYVRKDSKRTYEAPGLNWVNLTVILLTAIYFFYNGRKIN